VKALQCLLLTQSGHEVLGPPGVTNGTILDPKCDILLIPDVVLGAGEAMRRREFIRLLGSTVVAWPLAARAQQQRVRRIGVLHVLAADDPVAKANKAGFEKALEQLGWSLERDLHIDFRFAGASERYQPLAQELLALQPDVVVAGTTPVAVIMQQQTHTIPIVFVPSSDPIGAGLVASLAHPGGNVTGVLLYEEGIAGKWLAMLKEIAPGVTRAGLLINPKTNIFDYVLRTTRAAAPALAIEIVPLPIESSDTDIERAVTSFASTPNGALVVPPDSTTIAYRDFVIALAARYHLPEVYGYRSMVDAGSLMSYGVDLVDLWRLSASYVDRILRGANPADLPVQAPTKFETVVNLKTAKALGLDVPPSLLVRADAVIE
jgi:putative tryptophan/tyrosine transport system substrate-binding protein